MMYKSIKNNKGFTLVEVIVVAVIVLILAAVAIPLYNGYIRDTRKSVAESTAASVASLLSAANQSALAGKDVIVSAITPGSNNGGGIRVTHGTTAGEDGDANTTDVIFPKKYMVTIDTDAWTVTGVACIKEDDTIESDPIQFSNTEPAVTGLIETYGLCS